MDSETFTPDNLIAGPFPIVTDEVTVLTGQDLARGCVLGYQTSGGKAVACHKAGTDDGRREAKSILAEDCDSTLGDVEHVPVYITGEFNANALSFGATTTVAANVEVELRDLSIFLKDPETPVE